MLCTRCYSTKASLMAHEKCKHLNNKRIPHFDQLPPTTVFDATQFRNSFVVQIKRRLQFNRRSSRKKTLTIEPFPERLFISLFASETSFTYNSSQRKYTCTFNGSSDSIRLGRILQIQNWNTKKNLQTGTTAYVLAEKNGTTYPIAFCWKEQNYKEFGRTLTELLYGMLKCSFYTAVGDFEVCMRCLSTILLLKILSIYSFSFYRVEHLPWIKHVCLQNMYNKI